MNLNMTNALELAEYARSAAIELLDYAYSAYNDDMHQTDYDSECTAIDAARYISADQLESAAFANNDTIDAFPDDLPMIITFALIEHYIMNITNCAESDICAEY